MLSTLFLLCVTPSAVEALGAPCEGSKCAPNFVFVLADDWGWGDLAADSTKPAGSAGSAGPAHTPHLNALAASGTLFVDFHVANPVCSPSRAGIMTGRDPARFAIHTALSGDPAANAAEGQANFLEPNVTTITQVMHDNGYSTGHFGKWHLGSAPGTPEPTAYGIDESCTFNSNDPCKADGHTGVRSYVHLTAASGLECKGAGGCECGHGAVITLLLRKPSLSLSLSLSLYLQQIVRP
jgi:hypothetical protein